MKLITNFKDYYDGVLHSTFRDEDRTMYKRETFQNFEDKYGNKKYYYYYPSVTLDKFSLNIYFHSIVFCGSLYKYIIVEQKNNLDGKKSTKCFQNQYDYTEYLKTFKDFKTKRRTYHTSWDSDYSIKKFFEMGKDLDITSLSYEYKSFAIYIINLSKKEYIVNPKLSEYNFEKIKEPYIAAQEVYNYISGVLSCVCTPETNFTDKDILTAKGFDPITSFRKM